MFEYHRESGKYEYLDDMLSFEYFDSLINQAYSTYPSLNSLKEFKIERLISLFKELDAKMMVENIKKVLTSVKNLIFPIIFCFCTQATGVLSPRTAADIQVPQALRPWE